jgi:hypothetical protein
MGGRSYWCQFCNKSFISKETWDTHEKACFVSRHERIIPADVVIPRPTKKDA